jgi:AcrR family transcriptional regulator
VVFAGKGFEGASTREIAAAAGVNISSLHYHWESKETLYRRLREHLRHRLAGALRYRNREPVRRQVVDDAMGCCSTSPTTERLLLMGAASGSTEGTNDIDRDILLPAWRASRADVRSQQVDR